MRLIHTSDWHLGRSFHGVGLLDHQAGYVDHLVEVVRAEGVDAVLVAGDVYDRALPAPATVTLLSQAVQRLVDAGAQVVISSGNHDSAIRLGFASSLLERSGLHIRSAVADIGRPVLVGDVAVYPLPYLQPELTRAALGATSVSHEAVLTAAMGRVRADLATRGEVASVVMAHAFVSGGAASGSERDITVGGVEAVPSGVFAGVDHVALGHLHGRQRVGATARYSGSPLAMSFGEATHRKGSWLMEIDRTGIRQDEFLPAPVPRPLVRLRGTLEDLLSDPAHTAAQDAWCSVVLTDPLRPLGAMDRLRRRFPHTLELDFDPPSDAVRATRPYRRRTDQPTQLDVCCAFLEHVTGGREASTPQRELLQRGIEAARADRARADDEGVARCGAELRADATAGSSQGVA